jgi:fructokinase
MHDATPNPKPNQAPQILCAGEALTDMIHQGGEQWVSRVGGSVWNVARALAVLGEPTAFAGAISRDRFGDALWAASEEAGLDRHLHAALAAGSAACLQAGATPPPPAAMHRLFELLQGEAT